MPLQPLDSILLYKITRQGLVHQISEQQTQLILKQRGDQ